MTGDLLVASVERQRVPELRRGDAVAMGSLAGHEWAAVESAGERTVGGRWSFLGRALDAFAPAGCRNSFRLGRGAALGVDFATSEKQDRKGRRDGRSVRGFEPKVLGYLTWDRKANAFTRFDVIALGEAYGTPGGDHHFNYRTGRHPVGISMDLVSGTTPAERVPPRASVVYDTPNPAYFATGK
jgi:hypothetical protein